MKKIILILLVILTYSCGARKVDINKEKIEVNSKSSNWFADQKNIDFKQIEGIKTISEYSKESIDSSQTIVEEITYEPDDCSKPASITDSNGKKTILDNVKMTTKKSTQKNSIKSKESGTKTESKDLKTDLKDNGSSKSNLNSESNSTSDKKDKTIEKEKWSVFNLFWLLIPLGLIYLAYWAWKRYRGAIPI